MFSTPANFFVLCQISPFHKLSSNFFRFWWTLIILSIPKSSKWSFSFWINLLKSVYIYALHRLFRTPQPFSSPLFHKPNIVCSGSHTTKLPVLQFSLTFLSLLPLSTKLFPKTYSTANMALQRLNSKHYVQVPIRCVVCTVGQ
jgi:hypothetical protein